jgi:hypothetical protein
MKWKFEDHPVLSLLQVVFVLVFILGWPLVIGHRLQHYFPGANGMNYRRYTFFSIILAILAAFITLNLTLPHLPFSKKDMPVVIAIITATVLFLYCAYFTSSMLSSIEEKKKASFEDNLGPFAAILCLPIGICLLQPMIRKVMEEKDQMRDLVVNH